MTEPMSMLERVARAMYEAGGWKRYYHPSRWERLHPIDHDTWLAMARAALEAMRNPTDSMVAAGVDALDRGEPVWSAMLDAALAEHRPREEGS